MRTEFPNQDIQIWSFLIADTDPDLIYAGASPINVYRSDDRGLSWRRLPTPDIPERCSGPFAARVMRMAQRPGNPKEIYAALEIAGAMRTTDGGESWTKVLDISEHTGVTDLVMDPRDPDVLIAAAWQRQRKVWTLVAGGPESGLYKTTDGGETWNELARGLPSVETGRYGLCLSPANPDYVYAVVEADTTALYPPDRGVTTEGGGAATHSVWRDATSRCHRARPARSVAGRDQAPVIDGPHRQCLAHLGGHVLGDLLAIRSVGDDVDGEVQARDHADEGRHQEELAAEQELLAEQIEPGGPVFAAGQFARRRPLPHGGIAHGDIQAHSDIQAHGDTQDGDILDILSHARSSSSVWDMRFLSPVSPPYR